MNSVGARFGDTVLASNAVLIQLFFLMAFGMNSFAHVSEALVGHAVGARSPSELRAGSGYTLFWSLALATFLTLRTVLLATFPPDAKPCSRYNPHMALRSSTITALPDSRLCVAPVDGVDRLTEICS